MVPGGSAAQGALLRVSPHSAWPWWVHSFSQMLPSPFGPCTGTRAVLTCRAWLLLSAQCLNPPPVPHRGCSMGDFHLPKGGEDKQDMRSEDKQDM